MRQEYSAEVLQLVCDKYKSLGPIKRSFLFTTGYENSNYFVETESGKFVIKVFEGLDISEGNIDFEIEVMEACFKAGLKTPHVLRSKSGELFVILNNKHVIVMDFIEGENMDEKEINDDLAYKVGQEVGKMDKVLSVFKDGSKTRQNYEWDLKNFLPLENKIKYLTEEFDQKLIQSIFNNFRAIKPTFDLLPKGIIHNDIGSHNILAVDGELQAIIDFSDLAFSPYIQNLSIPMSQMFFCYNWQPKQAKVFIKGYNEFHPVSNKELELLYDVTCARFTTLVVEFNYWNKVLFGEDKQRVQTVTNFYKYLIKFIDFGKEDFNKIVIGI